MTCVRMCIYRESESVFNFYLNNVAQLILLYLSCSNLKCVMQREILQQVGRNRKEGTWYRGKGLRGDDAILLPFCD